jgi:hypothetical protein
MKKKQVKGLVVKSALKAGIVIGSRSIVIGSGPLNTNGTNGIVIGASIEPTDEGAARGAARATLSVERVRRPSA